MDDIERLREFASQHSDEAFRTVIERHIDFVYGVALRNSVTVTRRKKLFRPCSSILRAKPP